MNALTPAYFTVNGEFISKMMYSLEDFWIPNNSSQTAQLIKFRFLLRQRICLGRMAVFQ